MKLLLALPLMIAGVILALAIANPIAERLSDSNAFQRQQEALQLAEQAAKLQDWQQQQAATAASRALTSNMLQLASGLLVIVIVLGIIDYYRQRRAPILRVEGIPIGRQFAEQGATIPMLADRLYAGGIAQIEAARRPNVPVTFAPHISSRSADIALPEPVQALTAAVEVPTFAALLDRGRVGKGNPLILGFDESDNSEISGTWLDLYSTAIGGLPGSGKTTSQRFLACQTALQGAKFAIIDPHAGAASDSLAATLAPLSSAFVCEPASDDKAILEVVRYVADVGQRRISGKDSDTTPLILWADELTALLGRSTVADELAELLERVAQEYRKRFVFVCGSGQIWTAARTTSELRDSFASVLCHRMKRSQARMLLPTEEASQVERLATGHAVLWRTSGATSTIAIPNTTATDVARVAQLLTDNQPTMERVSVRLQSEVNQTVASGTAAPQSAETARIVGLFMDGHDAGAIVQQIYGLNSRGGQPYMRRLSEVQAAIRSALVARAA
jgi:hypothetical protein